VEIGDVAIAAAIAAGVDRFVFHSVLLPKVEAMPHHWLKQHVEQRLQASGLAFTILRPCAYMQNILPQFPLMVDHGRLEVPYNVDARFSLVDLPDVAAAAAAVILEPGHEGSTYELCGPEGISHRQMAGALGAALGRPVEAVAIDPLRWAAARSAGLGEYQLGALLRMFRWYDENDFAGSSADLEDLLGRPAGSFDDFVRREIRG
jgi:NAD(P)H dehydrogenase (quinone)